MNKLSYLLVLFLGVLLFWAYDTVDARILSRSLQEVAEEKRTDFLAGFPEKAALQTTMETATWRTLPMIGRAHAKVAISVRHLMPPDGKFEQTFQFYYDWQESAWVEMAGACGHGQTPAEETAHHMH